MGELREKILISNDFMFNELVEGGVTFYNKHLKKTYGL